jgi:hypothetical protein
VAEAWLERGRGQKGPWDATTRERYERVVRLQVLASADPTRRPLGETKLRDVTPDRVAVWSQGNEQALAPSTAWLALIALNQVCRYAVRRGWLGVNPVAQLEPGEKPRTRSGFRSISLSLVRITREHMRHPHPDPLPLRGRGSRFDPLAPGGGDGRVRGRS